MMKNLTKNISSTLGLLVVISASNFSIAQETTPSISAFKVTNASQSYKKIRQSKSLALNTFKRSDILPSPTSAKKKGQYLVHDALPSGSFNGKQ
ncbi:hypothetical protein [Alteromonas macleodii]|uniref:hypothetical protein n=1 Tax=Alteromonas macleodii TaxID=28108 RepID=UPI0015D15FAF|nr:hypothetical protein [Alteromonas macleodii]